MMEDGVRRSEVFRYLGYGNRVPDEETGELAEECIKELLRVSEERICVREFPVTVQGREPGLRLFPDLQQKSFKEPGRLRPGSCDGGDPGDGSGPAAP